VTGESFRRILHCDMDCFYAAVHVRDDPSLAGKPVAVGGSPEGRGVVAAASYEIRRYGVRSAMPAARAKRLCPHAVFLRPDFPRYRRESRTIFRIFAEYADVVQPVSIDEAYLDCSASFERFGSARRVAEEIKRRVHEERGLTVSVGAGPNKLVAKVASDVGKPDGLMVVRPRHVVEFLAPLPVRALPGVGPVTEMKLRARGVEKVSDVRSLSLQALEKVVGSFGERLYRFSRGIDDRPVRADRERKSLSSERTFSSDLQSFADMDAALEALATSVARGLGKGRLLACTLTVKVRFDDFETVTRSQTAGTPFSSDVAAIAACARSLLRRTDAGTRRVRLLGVGASNFVRGGGEQLPLFGGVDLGEAAPLDRDGGRSSRADAS
jgi:DNA polymerase-4